LKILEKQTRDEVLMIFFFFINFRGCNGELSFDFPHY